jgi:hypothetical protein
MSCVILSPFACHSEAEPKNLKDCSGHSGEESLRSFTESTLSRIRSFAEFTLSDANVLRMTGSEAFRGTNEGFRMTGFHQRSIAARPVERTSETGH